jgi:Zn-dependent protease with chaperone function
MGENTPSGFKEETLSEKNYSELYKDVRALQSQLQRDFPNETLPPVTIVDTNTIYAKYDGSDGKGERIEISKGLFNVLGGGKTPESRERITALLAHEYGHDAGNHSEKIEQLGNKLKTDSQVYAFYEKAEKEADSIAARHVNPKDLASALNGYLNAALKDSSQSIGKEQRDAVLERIRLLNEGKSHEAHPSEVHCAPTPNTAPKRQQEGVLGH